MPLRMSIKSRLGTCRLTTHPKKSFNLPRPHCSGRQVSEGGLDQFGLCEVCSRAGSWPCSSFKRSSCCFSEEMRLVCCFRKPAPMHCLSIATDVGKALEARSMLLMSDDAVCGSRANYIDSINDRPLRCYFGALNVPADIGKSKFIQI